jgi:hypothetical protein
MVALGLCKLLRKSGEAEQQRRNKAPTSKKAQKQRSGKAKKQKSKEV